MIKIIHFLCFAVLGVACATANSAPLSTPGSNAAVQNAQSYIGTKYKYAGTSVAGMDCSGLTTVVYRNVGVSLPRTASAQSKTGRRINANEALPGDLVFFKKGGNVFHVGIVSKVSSERLWMIHSSSAKGVVEQEVLSSSYWAPKLHIVKRVF